MLSYVKYPVELAGFLQTKSARSLATFLFVAVS